MARLVVKSDHVSDKVIELRLGLNRLGRGPGNDFRIEDSTISTSHCEIVTSEDGVMLRDCGSTNGTFLNGQPVQDAKLEAGQVLHLGDVEFLVENADVNVAIPHIEVPIPAPPVVKSDGSLICPRHPGVRVTHQCTHCREVMCEDCVHHLRRRGGKTLLLCPFCSHACPPIGGEKKKKRSLLGLFQKTVKIPLLRRHKRDD